MRTPWLAFLGLVIALEACGTGGNEPSAGKEETTPGSAPGGRANMEDRNACHLLSHEEVSALTGRTITMRDQTESSETYSTCDYSDSEDQFAFGITVYWEGGRTQWETWRTASGIAQDLFENQEGVDINEIVTQGPVAGLGDAAYFSELLPSLVLKGDVLCELKMALVPESGKKFRALAETLLSQI